MAGYMATFHESLRREAESLAIRRQIAEEMALKAKIAEQMLMMAKALGLVGPGMPLP